MDDKDEQLQSVLHTLEECRALLMESRNQETAELVSIAILDLRMKLNRIGSSELRALCDEILGEAASEPLQRVEQDRSRRPLLRVVK